MLNFVYDNKTTLIFGKGTHHETGTLLKPLGKKILLHYGSGSIRRSGLYDAVTASLKAAGVEYEELGGVQANPTLPLVYEGIRLCREHGLGLVLAVGGGSVIDSAKAIALGVPHEGDVWELYLSKKQPQSDPLPVATVLTIPAAGSESSPNTVITNEETRRKLGYGSPKLRPVFSIINPELFFTLPHRQMANGISDMMSHIFERYFTKTLHTDLSDSLCEATLRTIMKNARILNGNLNDYNAWAEIAFSGNIAHNNLLGVGREQDWGCHAMEHELSALYHVDHGAGLAHRVAVGDGGGVSEFLGHGVAVEDLALGKAHLYLARGPLPRGFKRFARAALVRICRLQHGDGLSGKVQRPQHHDPVRALRKQYCEIGQIF